MVLRRDRRSGARVRARSGDDRRAFLDMLARIIRKRPGDDWRGARPWRDRTARALRVAFDPAVSQPV
jgi:hypothetical protein